MAEAPSRKQAERILQEVAKRAANVSKIDFDKLSFGPQRDFINDDSPRVAALCTRRAGKTAGMALKALRTAMKMPHSMVVYIGPSRPNAKRAMWPHLLQWNRELKLGAKFNHAELTMTLPNGSQILLGGANDSGEIERYRGLASPLIIVDEAGHFRSFLKGLIEEVLMPATMDYDGQIVLIGTPNAACIGYFYDITTGAQPGWSNHQWTVYDNPHIPHAKAWVENMIKERGLTWEHPAIRREYLGEWVRNSEGLVFQVPEIAILDEFDPEETDWHYVLGVDIGYVDATAFVLLAYDTTSARSVVVESHQQSGMIPSRIAVEIERLWNTHDLESVVIDPGGGGKLIVEELKQRYGIPADVAQKRGKHDFIELMNGDFRAGSCQIVRAGNEELLHDLSLLQWDYARLERKGKGAFGGKTPKDLLQIDDRTPDHLADAMLYGYRECKAYLYDPKQNAPKRGTAEWWEAEEQKLLDAAISRQKDSGEAWWERGY